MSTADVKESRESYTVLGAGIIGVCVALALQRDGHDVSLIDRDEPGQACSFGNAGLLHAGGCIPLATWANIKRLPAVLLGKSESFRIPLDEIVRLLPWLGAFAAQATPGREEHNTRALSHLLASAWPAYSRLLRDTGAEALVKGTGELYVYRSKEAFDSASLEMRTRERFGVSVEYLDKQAVRSKEPALSDEYRYGHYLPDSRLVINPAKFTQHLVRVFVERGGVVHRKEVLTVRPDAQGGAQLTTIDGCWNVPNIVVCCGVWSGRLAREFGVRAPVESWRGYHITVPPNDIVLNTVAVDGEKHVAVSPMGDQLRVVGYLEMEGLNKPAQPSRAKVLLRDAKSMIPGLSTTISSTWSGHRPGTPDSLPVISTVPEHKGIYLAFGHGQLGLTFGAITGELMADLVAGRRSVIDLTAYDAKRFGTLARA